MKKLIAGLVVILAVGAVASLLWPSVRSSRDLPAISYQDSFLQDRAEYFVYFYMEQCHFCQELEPYILKFHNEGVPIYVVDMADPANANAWYDWDTHHEQHTQVVGEVADGEIIFHEGINEEDFSRTDGWEIVEVDGHAIARLNRADFNRTPATYEELEVTGTPMMLHIINGQAVGFDSGVQVSRDMLASYAGRHE